MAVFKWLRSLVCDSLTQISGIKCTISLSDATDG